MSKKPFELRVVGLYDSKSYVTGWPSVVVSFATYNLDRIRSVRPLATHHDFTIADSLDALHPLAALLIGFGLPPAEVWTQVRRVRPIALGNAHMIAEIDIAAGANRAFWNAWVQDARRTETWTAPHVPVTTDEQLRALVASQVPRKRKERR